ncbi:MAG: hypothetical protein ACTSV2_16530 [Candidatus Thorarchaeota archaeon]
MMKFSEKMNREDVVSLRWPKACLSCGIDVSDEIKPRYAIVGMFHVIKKTQVLAKLPGFFYMCEKCQNEIDVAVALSSEKSTTYGELAKILNDNPWNEFIKLGKTGTVEIPEGLFRKKLQQENPDVVVKSKKCPMNELRQKIRKG